MICLIWEFETQTEILEGTMFEQNGFRGQSSSVLLSARRSILRSINVRWEEAVPISYRELLHLVCVHVIYLDSQPGQL